MANIMKNVIGPDFSLPLVIYPSIIHIISPYSKYSVRKYMYDQ